MDTLLIKDGDLELHLSSTNKGVSVGIETTSERLDIALDAADTERLAKWLDERWNSR